MIKQNLPKSNKKTQQNHDYKSNLVQKCQALSKERLKLYNTILYYRNKYKRVLPRQRTLAWHAGVTRESANRWCQEFVGLGLLAIHHRPGDSNVYSFPQWLDDPNIRWALSRFFPSLLFVISSLLSNTQSCQSVFDHTLINKENIYIYKPLTVNVKRLESLSYCKSNGTGNGFFQKRDRMEIFKREKWATNISDLSRLNLTQYGALDLSQFPDEAIRQAGNYIEKTDKTTLRDPFRLVVKKCRDWCTANNVQSDYRGVKEKWELLKWPDPMTVQKVNPDNPFINPPKPKNGKNEAKYEHTLLRESKFPQIKRDKTFEEESLEEMQQNFAKLKESDQYKKNKQTVGTEMASYMESWMENAMAQKRYNEKNERKFDEERIVFEAQQMKIE